MAESVNQSKFAIFQNADGEPAVAARFENDDERLKQGGNRYFKELLQRIRDIRASERNFYQQVTDIYATAVDYDPRAEITREFFLQGGMYHHERGRRRRGDGSLRVAAQSFV